MKVLLLTFPEAESTYLRYRKSSTESGLAIGTCILLMFHCIDGDNGNNHYVLPPNKQIQLMAILPRRGTWHLYNLLQAVALHNLINFIGYHKV